MTRSTPIGRISAPPARAAVLNHSRLISEEHDLRHARAAIWTLVTALVLFLGWAGATPVHEVVSGGGRILPEGETLRVEHVDGGRVIEIAVTEGQTVAVGDVLLRLGAGELKAELRKVATRIAMLDDEIARHEAMLALDLANDAPAPDLIARLDPGLAEDIDYRLSQIAAIRAERPVVMARRAALDGRDMTLRSELAILRSQAARYAAASDPGLFLRRDLENLDREILGLERMLADAEGEAGILDATLRQIDLREAELIAALRREAALRLGEQRERRAELGETQGQLSARAGAMTVRAEAAGTVARVAVRGVGEVIAAGETVMEIVPGGGRVRVEIEVPADRIGGVSVGQTANVKVLTYDFTRFGEIQAVVDRISPSSYRDEMGRDIFRLYLSMEADNARRWGGGKGPMPAISPGMTVTASIRTDSRTVLSYLVRPARIVASGAFTES